jgi:hypothetical protein
MSRTHADFLDELTASSEAVEHVARWLTRERGLPVLLRPLYQSPTFEQRADYADDGDLGVVLGVEVKRRRLLFTGKADYPYPTAIIEAVPSYDKKRPSPYCYVLLNQSMTAGLVVDVGRTRRHWQKITIYESRNQLNQQVYACDVSLLGEVSFGANGR